jgi:polyhydroxyalkanoate synthesis regulator phasin
MARTPKGASGVPDAVRRAVNRTIQSTLGPAGLTRERAQELADDVLRRAEHGAARAGKAMGGAGQRQREAAAGVGDRVKDAIADLRGPASDDLEQLRSEVEMLRLRVDQLERKLGAPGRRAAATKSRQAKTSAARSAARKRSGSER